jgi:GTPase SAR1 family protein
LDEIKSVDYDACVAGLIVAVVGLIFDPGTAVIMVVAGLLVLAIYRTGAFLRKWLNYLLDWSFWSLSRFLQKSLSSRLSLRKYCRLQLGAEESKYLDVPGATSQPLQTDEAYVPLLLDEGRNGELSFSHETILEAGSRLCIVGDPGSGKSSLLKRLYRDACRRGIASPKTARLPVRIELKHLSLPETLHDDAEELADWGIEHIRSLLAPVAAFDMAECFDSYVANGGLLLLLDGLDEVPSNRYAQTARLINALSSRLAALSDRNVVALTMRRQFHRQVQRDFTSSFPHTLHIRPFSPNDVFLFLTRWPFPEKMLAGEVNRIYADLNDRPTLREMCTNPLVLAMYVAGDERASDSSELPETRSSFYRQVVVELLILRRGRQVGAAAARTAQQRQRESILGKLALDHLLDPDQPANVLSWEAAVSIACAVLENDDRERAELYLRELSKDTGLFTEERTGESLRFIHLTFCEFFAALEAADGREHGWEEVLAAHHRFQASETLQVRTRLAEVVPFTMGLLTRSRVSAMLDQVLLQVDLQVLARCFLETQHYGSRQWEEFAAREAARLVATQPQDWDEDWLSELHLFSVALREAERWAATLGRASASVTQETLFRDLVGEDEERLVRVFSSYAARDAAASFRLAEACKVDLVLARPDLVVDACQQPPFLALVMQRAAADPDGGSMWPSILAEAGLRYQVVAAELHDEAPLAGWGARVAAAGRENAWHSSVLAKRSLYSDSLTIACERERGPQVDTMFPLTKSLVFLHGPGMVVSRVQLRWLCALIAIVLLGLIPTLFTALAAVFPEGRLVLVSAVVVASSFAYWTSLEVLLYPRHRIQAYRMLANLRSSAVIAPLGDLFALFAWRFGPADVDNLPSERTAPIPRLRWLARRAATDQLLLASFMSRLRSAVGNELLERPVYRVQAKSGISLTVEPADVRFRAVLVWRDRFHTLLTAEDLAAPTLADFTAVLPESSAA